MRIPYSNLVARMNVPVSLACLAFCMLLSLRGFSQGGLEFASPKGDSSKTVIILNDDHYRFEQKDSVTSLVFLVGNVRLQEDRTLIYCDSMIRNGHDNFIECFGHVRIFDGDSTNIYSDYMKYEALTKNVLFQKNVKLTDGKGVLTTQELHYDLNTKIGIYLHGGKVINDGSVLTSEEATYYEESKNIYFRKNVILRDPQYDLSADSLLYNTETRKSHFITETFIQFKDSTQRTVRTREGSYDLLNKKAQFGKRSLITDGSQQITGDSIRIDDSTGLSTVRGNGIYKDTAQGIVIHANYMVNDKKRSTFLATQHPVLVMKQDKDSIYLAADTLLAGRLIDEEVEVAAAAHQDSLHQVYVDSLYKVSTDSLHRIALARQSRAESDTVQSDTVQSGTDSTHRMVIKDESRDRVFDSAHLSPSDTGRAVARAPDSIRSTSRLSDASPANNRAPDNNRAVAHPSDTSRAVTRPHNTGPKDPRLPDSIGRRPPPGLIAMDSSRRARLNRDFARGIFVADSTHRAGQEASYRRAAIADSNRRAAALVRGDDRVNTRSVLANANRPPPPTDSTMRYIKAFHGVRIFSDSLQAVADSMFYSGKDSIFRLFKDPIAWSNGANQVTGDTMFVYTINKKADRLYVFENGLAINKVGPNFYNQIKGTTINGYFKDGQVDFMRAKGSAESIYYVADDTKAYTGVNKAHADIIDMIFENKDLKKVVLRSDAAGSMIPFRKVNFDDMRLRGFKWRDDLRPKSKFELLGDSLKPAIPLSLTGLVTPSPAATSPAATSPVISKKASSPAKLPL
jgi:lipopolysaccharide export system protein LptA